MVEYKLTSINLSDEISFITLCCRNNEEEITANINNLLLRQFNWQYVLKLAYLHGLAGIIYKNSLLCKDTALIPSSILETLKKSYLSTCYKNMLFIKEYNNINQQLYNNNIPNIPLKGIFYLKELYNDLGERQISDIDILVRKHDIKHAEQILKNNGYVKKKSLLANKKNLFHLIYWRKQGAITFTIELHWDIDFQDSPFKIPIEELWTRAEKIQNGTCFFYKFSLEDDIIFNCVHILRGKHLGAVSLKNFCDLSKIILKFPEKIDWNIIIERSEQYHVSRPVYIVMLLLQIIFNASVPMDKINKLRKPGFHENILKTIINEKIFITTSNEKILLPNILSNGLSEKLYKNITSFFFNVFKVFFRVLQANYYDDTRFSYARALLKTVYACLLSIKKYIKIIYIYLFEHDKIEKIIYKERKNKIDKDEVNKWLYYSN